VGTQRLDDVIVDPEIFKQAVAKAVGFEEKAGAVFLQRLVNGASDLLGNISLKMLNRLVTLHLSAASEMEYSKTLGSPQGKKLEFAFLRSSPSTQQKLAGGKEKRENGIPIFIRRLEIPIKTKPKAKEVPAPVAKAKEKYEDERESFEEPLAAELANVESHPDSVPHEAKHVEPEPRMVQPAGSVPDDDKDKLDTNPDKGPEF